MNTQELITLIDRFREERSEQEWLEFKENNYEPQALGEYLSALANAACVAGKPRGYLVFGVQDGSHRVVGTSFDPYTAKGKGHQDLILWLSMGLQPNVGFDVHVLEHPKGRVVLFEVKAASDRPVHFYGTAYIRIGTSKTELHKHPEKERAIWTHRADWSGQTCEGATIGDIDPEALAKAREQFRIKHPGQGSLMTGWDDATFLNKAKLTVRGMITHTALLLLGRGETAALLSPGVAKISWILKDAYNKELDYEHFGPPFVLAVDRLLGRIRNLTVRALPSGTLFPQEISQYDPWVIREALHNCIAHQDYNLRGRINVVEMPDSILLTNLGSFLPGDVETVIRQDAPLEIYRNPFLADAMVALNMIDTQGGGIKRMFQLQRQRFFPLPDYDLSEPDRVVVKLPGRILDEHYTRLLMDRGDLNLWQVMLLDRVQKRLPISHEAHHQLKSAGLVEGRYPNLIIAAPIARLTGQKARHIKDRGLDKKYYLDMIITLVKVHGSASREEIDQLLMDKLPDALDRNQKRHKIHNLLGELVRSGKIVNEGSRVKSRWKLARKT
ncbi:MAG: Divergent AAA domain protein [Syntrophorhabdus sp. PtaB.Bin006]|nr:MAG: Divergent AAA domain protein [Syntrophorhabdus sp. PtaB.Bin006]OPY85300.1 MAG: Divergent AAA domain protein [Syntrophorhabdus sp. PtaU1.Bin153]